MQRIDKFLKVSLAKKGLLGAATSAHICFIAEKWGDGKFSPISFSKGILKVAVNCSSAAAELQIQEEKLIEFINKKLDREIVKAVRIVVAPNNF